MFRINIEGVSKFHEYDELLKIFLTPKDYEIVNRGFVGSREINISHIDKNRLQSMMDSSDKFQMQDGTGTDGLLDFDFSVDDCKITSQKELEQVIALAARNVDADLVIPFNPDKNKMKEFIFEFFSKETGICPPWGIITGIRPVKMTGEYLDNHSVAETKSLLTDYYHVSEEKANLALSMYQHQMAMVGRAPKDSVGLYIGIPFCPTRCLYCSFASNQVSDEEKQRYVEALVKEIEATKQLIKSKGFWIESVYIGGGTPTALTESQLDRMLGALDSLIQESNDCYNSIHGSQKKTKEITLEAGRPDTITAEKLHIASNHGITRISINPQSMKDETLQRIGRNHDADMVIEAFKLVHSFGFNDVNSDIIAGLPGETLEDFANTIDAVIALNPTSITVHSLAVKRASKLIEADENYHYKKGDIVGEMLDYSRKILEEKGFIPYYLYRQKHMSGAQENTGYAKKSYESIYNIRIMDEHQSIIALGANGVSKVFDPATNRFDRVANLTNYQLYIERIDEMIERKNKAFL